LYNRDSSAGHEPRAALQIGRRFLERDTAPSPLARRCGVTGCALKRCIVEEMQQFSGCRIH
jgi:hypothetical protein